jgi:hypothetical protein
VDSRPVRELTELAAFLGGRPQPRVTWQRLQSKYPEAFTTSKEEIVRWHESQVEESELEDAWAAGAFHLEILLKFKPGDTALARHLARVKEHLKKD